MIKNTQSPALRRYQVSSLSLIGIIAIALGTSTPLAQAALLEKWRFDSANNQLEFTLQNQTTPRYFLLTQPPRIVLELPNTQMGKVPTVQNYTGVVREVRVAQFTENLTRIVLELSPEVVLAPGMVQLKQVTPGSGDRWLLRPLITRTPATPATPQQRQSHASLLNGGVGSKGQEREPPHGAGSPTPSTNLPPATINSQQPVFVNVPPLSASNQPEASPTKPTSTPLSDVIQFGDPLPVSPVTTTPRNSLPILQPDTSVLPEITDTVTTETPVVVPTLK